MYAPPIMPTTRFRADIEGLRAVAVLGVVMFHTGVPWLRGGYVGVDVFYVISGFLITEMMSRDVQESTPGFGRFLTEFYARRVRRILPAATLVLLVTLLGASLLQNPIENSDLVSDARATTLFYSNVQFAAHASNYFADGSSPSPLLQYWSLSLEEQFYVVWPVLFFIMVTALTRGRLRRTPTIGIGVIVAASFVASVIWVRVDPVRAFYLLPARAWELGLGALLATFGDRLDFLRSRNKSALSIVGLIAILTAMVFYTKSMAFPGEAALLPTAGAVLVIAAGCGRPNEGSGFSLLTSRPMQFVGRYSFSLYLWHWPVVAMRIEHIKWMYANWPIRTVFVFAMSVPAAVVTYHLIENPIRRARKLRTSVARSLALGAVLVSAGLLGTVIFENFGSTARLSTDRTVAATGERLAPMILPTDFVPANLVPSLAASRDRTYIQCGTPCVVGLAGVSKRIVLFGDSHALQWGPAFQAAVNALGAELELDWSGNCASFLIPIELLSATDKQECDRTRLTVFASLKANPPDIVVFSNTTSNVFAVNPEQWERGIRDAIRRVPKSTMVLIFAETPRGSESVPLCLAHNLEHAERCDQRWPVEENARLDTIARDEGARFIDLRSQFCTTTRCPAITQDVLIYGDASHLSVPFSRTRGPWVTELLRPLLASRR